MVIFSMKEVKLILFLGIDPSTTNTGLAVVDENKTVYYVGDLKGKADSPDFFYDLYAQIETILMNFDITAIAVEDQFMSNNADTLKKLARVSGIVLTLAGKFNLPCYLQIPAAWRKYWVKESGILPYDPKDSYKKKNAYSKFECFYVLQLYFQDYLSNFKKHNDIADALGIAWSCSQIFLEGGLHTKEKKKRAKKKTNKKKATKEKS
ncbi:hypothetical protein A5882_003608 [Enterococcus sp. 4E1_DIV0656]|nr:hypothetical protein A5882_003608 [Enterococcus sp. 4E1_DIV0656]